MLFPNLPIKTAGGKVFWDTFDRRNGWKLQQNRLTGHFRILDPEDVRQALWLAFRKFGGSNVDPKVVVWSRVYSIFRRYFGVIPHFAPLG